MATSLGPADAVDAAGFAKALRAGVDGVVQRGRAEAGDKTMFDALAPALDALDAGAGIRRGSGRRHCGRARVGRRKGHVMPPKPMVARKGRASYLGQRSVGHIGSGRDVGGDADRRGRNHIRRGRVTL